MPRGGSEVEEGSSTSIKDEGKKKKKPSQQSAPATTAEQQSTPFTATDFSQLAENEHARYLPTGKTKKVGHSVLKKRGDRTIAEQYLMPAVEEGDAPIVRPLMNIEAIEPFGRRRYRAETPDGHTPMYAKRFIQGMIGDADDEESIEIALFSPTEKKGRNLFGGRLNQHLF